MSLRSFEGAEALPDGLDSSRLGRLTWLGLLVAAIGWMLLLGVTVAGAALASPAHADFVEIARCLVGSGFGLALIGALQTGFGALNRFFSAVLTRSGPRGAPAPVSAAAAPPVDRSAPSLRERRPFQIMADGSVEVETIVGTRRFDTMDEAREFI